MRIRAVLLDMGGVLVPETTGYTGAAEDRDLLRRLSAQGITDPARLILERGEQLRNAYRALDAECSQPDPDVVFADLSPPVRAELLEAFRRESVRPAYPGAREVVAELACHYRLGLISNNVIPGDHHARNLEAAGIARYLDAAVWSANFGRRKPDPAMIFHVLDHLSVLPSEAIFVGDKLRTDVLAARRAGIPSVWLHRPGPQQSSEVEPDFVIENLDQLPGLLRDGLTSRAPVPAGRREGPEPRQ